MLVRATHSDGTSTTTKSSTGVVLDGGRILVNCHAVRQGPESKTDVDTIEVVLGKFDAASGTVKPSQWIPAKVHRCDHQRDLALLKIEAPLPATAALRIAARDAVVGQAVATLGHSWRGLPWTVHGCTIAGIGRPQRDATELLIAVSDEDRDRLRTQLKPSQMLETDCSTHPTYGSPVLDANGDVLGILQLSHFDSDADRPIPFFFYLAASEIRTFLGE